VISISPHDGRHPNTHSILPGKSEHIKISVASRICTQGHWNMGLGNSGCRTAGRSSRGATRIL
jgi:hypothetical protein